MARTKRNQVFTPDIVAVVHTICRVVRQEHLLGLTGDQPDRLLQRKDLIEQELERLASSFAIDLLGYSVMSNHVHQVLRSRPDIVAKWSNGQVVQRWLTLCPKRSTSKRKKGSSLPSQKEIDSVLANKELTAKLRSRLSDISWWMRLFCQRIAQQANREDDMVGPFWAGRFRAIRLLDEESVLACTAYVDLNPIRAGIAPTLEQSAYTSVKRRVLSQQSGSTSVSPSDSQCLTDQLEGDRHRPDAAATSADQFLAPVEIDELHDPLGPMASASGSRCSDKGFASIPTARYLELLDWTARNVVPGKPGRTPSDTPPLLERLGIKSEIWCELTRNFGRIFSHVAGTPASLEKYRSQAKGKPLHIPKAVNQVFEGKPFHPTQSNRRSDRSSQATLSA